MPRSGVRRGVIRVQGDKLCLMIGVKPGSKIPKDVMDRILKANLGETITICNREVIVSASMKVLVEILAGKDVIED